MYGLAPDSRRKFSPNRPGFLFFLLPGLWVNEISLNFAKLYINFVESRAVCYVGEEFDYMQCKLGCRFLMELAVHCENVKHVFVRSNLHFDLIVHGVYFRNILHTNVAENCYVSILVSCFLLEGFVVRSV